MATPAGLLKTKDAAQRAGYGVASFNAWRGQGKGPAFIRVGHKVFYDPADVDAWIAAGRVDPLRAPLANAEA
jgi:hypothetical protein